jgi:YidC/Oxa1 family membrane protein insertase
VFDIFSQAMLFLLDGLKGFLGSYGWAIIAVTALIRIVLWPLNAAQTRSMKQMQAIQPKFKKVQEQYKDNPQRLQQEMMKLYAENKFNPLSGCLPMLIQLPIFIGLYSALSSPDFLTRAGAESFGFVTQLHNTLHSYAGKPLDGTFAVNPKEKEEYHTGPMAKVYLKNGTLMERHIDDPAHALLLTPSPAIPGEPLNFKLMLEKLQLSPTDYLSRIDHVDVQVINQKSREIEVLKLMPGTAPGAESITAQVPTTLGKDTWHMDVLGLVAVYGLLTLAYQKIMQRFTPKMADAPAGQAQMMNMMTLVFVGMMFFIPIPAGVLLYLVVTMIFMAGQTLWVNLADKDKPSGDAPSNAVSVVTGGGNRPTVVDVKS